MCFASGVHFVLIDRCILTNLSQIPLNGDHNNELDRRLFMRGGPLRSQGFRLGELVLPLPHVSKIDRKRGFHKRDRPKGPVAYDQGRSKIL